MQPQRPKNVLICVYCGVAKGISRDHVPSKALLDKPYPDDLPCVEACESCNNGFSLNEEYLACLIECVLAGSADPEKISRPKIKRILQSKPLLRERLQKACRQVGEETFFEVEHDRISLVIEKLARGHAYFEDQELALNRSPISLKVFPLQVLPLYVKSSFDSPQGFWPDPGALTRNGGYTLERLIQNDCAWIEVQPQRYRYSIVNGDLLTVRIVMSEYLGAEASFQRQEI